MAGTEVLSAPFPIDRGVVQGDITSPLYFILALELILRTHDNASGKGIRFGDKVVDTLGYADDAALLDNDIAISTTRVTAIAQGSRKDADMEINVDKTEVMHVVEQDRVEPATDAELKAVCKFKCPHVGCSRVFQNAHGCKCHAGKCRRKDWHEVEKILDMEGETGSPARKFLIRWKGYGPEEDLWESRHHLHPDLINEYLHANNLYDHSWPGERCPWCDKPCKNARGVKTHMRWCGFKPDEQNFAGTCAEKRVRQDKLAAAQKLKQRVLCEGVALANVYNFKYLGSIFSADGNEENDVKRRIALAMERMGALRHVFDSNISLSLKLQVYKVAICSLLTYGCEAWLLSEKTVAMLNGANARCLSRFTGKDSHTEASPRTRTYDLVTAIRVRRFKWLGHILRMKGKRLVKLAVERQFALDLTGNMFCDVPPRLTLEQITKTAQDRKRWKLISSSISRGVLWPTPPPAPLRTTAITRAIMRATTAHPPATTAPQPPPPPTNPNSMNRYRDRDAHELFFRPLSKRASRPQPKPNKKKDRPTALTDKQRSAWAHAHFILHHGSKEAAASFLTKNRRAATIPEDMRRKLQQKCDAPDLTSTTPTALTPTPKTQTPVQPAMMQTHIDNTTTDKSPTPLSAKPPPTAPTSTWAMPT